VEGRAEVLTEGEQFRGSIDLLVEKYRQYREMDLDRVSGAVIAVTPSRLLAWRPTRC
jgi:hypothetical protein